MLRTLKILFTCSLFFLLAPMGIRAQEKPAQQSAVEVESLRKKLDEQQAQINRLQGLIEALQRKLEQTSTPAPIPAIQDKSTAAAQGTDEKTAAKAAPKNAQAVEIGYGKIRFNGLLQGWYAAGNGGFHDTFRIRRAELKFSGEITPKVKWTLMIDPAKALSTTNTFTTINGTKVLTDTSINQGGRILQDAFITFDYNKNTHVDFGQFKLPLGLEGQQSSTKLETVERALFIVDKARGGGLGDVRDQGVMIRGSFAHYVDYQIGLFNGVGESLNDVDKNDQKTVVGRVVVSPPFIKGLKVGGSGALAGGTSPDRPRRDRLGAELYFTHGPLTLKSELVTAKDADLQRIGYYGLAAYKITPKTEVVFRYDVFDPDRRHEDSLANVTERDYVAGFNYYITENNVKLQFNYLRKTFANAIVPARNLVLVNLQTSW